MPLPGEHMHHPGAEIGERPFIPMLSPTEKVQQRIDDLQGALRINLRLCIQGGMDAAQIMQAMQPLAEKLKAVSDHREVIGLYNDTVQKLVAYAVELVTEKNMSPEVIQTVFTAAITAIQKNMQSLTSAMPAQELDQALAQIGYIPTTYRTTGMRTAQHTQK